MGPHKGSFVKTHCAPNTIRPGHKLKEATVRRETAAPSLLLTAFKQVCIQRAVHLHLQVMFEHTQIQTVPLGLGKPLHSQCDHKVLFRVYPFANAVLTSCRKVQLKTHTNTITHSPIIFFSLHLGPHPCGSQGQQTVGRNIMINNSRSCFQ